MKVIIDRFEGSYAIVEMENKKTADLPIELVPKGAKEGTVINIVIDEKESEKIKKEVDGLMEDLWE